MPLFEIQVVKTKIYYRRMRINLMMRQVNRNSLMIK